MINTVLDRKKIEQSTRDIILPSLNLLMVIWKKISGGPTQQQYSCSTMRGISCCESVCDLKLDKLDQSRTSRTQPQKIVILMKTTKYETHQATANRQFYGVKGLLTKCTTERQENVYKTCTIKQTIYKFGTKTRVSEKKKDPW